MQRAVTHTGTFRLRARASVCALLVGATITTHAQKLTWIENPYSNPSQIYPAGVDNNGTVFVRYRRPSSGTFDAYRWRNGELLKLTPSTDDVLTCTPTEDGRIPLHAFGNTYFWQPSGLVYISSRSSITYAQGVTADGSVIVGDQVPSSGPGRAIVWQGGSLTTLPTPSGATGSEAQQISDNGLYIAGSVGYGSAGRACRWVFTNNGWQYLELGTLGGNYSRGGSISNDGRIIALVSTDAAGYLKACVWQATSGLTALPNLGGTQSTLANEGGLGRSMSADGVFIVGQGRTALDERRAVRWTRQSNGSYQVEDLNSTYSNLLQNGEVLTYAWTISRNGRYIAGTGIRNGVEQIFVLDTQYCELTEDITGDGSVDDADLLRVLFEFGSRCGGQ